MRIKKRDYNEYVVLDDGVWVRNFTLKEAPPVDQNGHLFTSKDLSTYLANETINFKLHLPQISAEQVRAKYVLIVSDGYSFTQKKEILTKLPRNIAVIGTNGVLHRWGFRSGFRPMAYYVVNNPYPECMKFLPRNATYLPPCLASVRTHSPFVKHFSENGIAFLYTPVSDRNYSGLNHGIGYYLIDDYRNPIVAAISLAYRFGASRIFTLCHDDCFADQRPAAIQVENGLWTYPQQLVSNSIINAHLGWLKNTNIKVGYNADGLKLTNAEYIQVEDIPHFFEES